MMYALYGTQGLYLDDVIANGVCRDTAAFFVVSDQPEEQRVNNNADALLFTHNVCVKSPQTLRIAWKNSPSRNSPRGFSAKHFNIKVKMRATLSCAIYHAAGLNVIQTATERYVPFKEAIQKVAGIYVTIHEIENYRENDLICSTYLLAEKETYPYVKVKDMKGMKTVYLDHVKVDPEYFDGYIMSEFNNERFFQKNGGKFQAVKNCDMKKLGEMCMNAADGICGTVLEIMRMTDDTRN